MGILSSILALPAAAGLLIALMPSASLRLAQAIALLASFATVLISWSLLATFDTGLSGLQFAESVAWVPEIGVNYTVGVDGLSLPMILLTTLLTCVAVVASIGTSKASSKAYFSWFMFMESAVLGVFLAQDWFLFYVFWELALMPMFFLIGVWGDEKRGVASMSFFLYTLAGSVLMLVGMMAAYLATPDHSFDMAKMALAHGGWSAEFQTLIFAAFFIGMAVKVPSVPLHGWLPLAHVQAPVPVSMMLSGVLLKMGAYGLFRALDVAPLGAQAFMPWLMVLGLISIVYGAFMAWRQDDLKSMVAYSSISHMGFVLVGLASFNPTGLSGAMMQMFTHGVVTGALFMLVGVVYTHTHTRRLSELIGVGRGSPRYAVVMTTTLLAAAGLPGLAGFVSEFNVLVGGYERWGLWVGIVGIGILVSSAYCLRVFGRFFVAPSGERALAMRDLNAREMAALAPLLLLMVVLGLFPGTLIQLSSHAIAQLAIFR